ncbi:MAG TPA: PBP1A family penicillin-binding protein [Candidatus Hydromicrobium sp.]
MSILRKKHKARKPSRVIVTIIAVILAVQLLFTFAFSGVIIFAFQAVASFFEDLPNLEDFSPTEEALTSRIYAADGTLIATFHGEENRELVSYEQIPKNLINAVIAIEDERFYQHKGFDIEGIIRSFIINLSSGEIEQGATTITQGYIKNVYMPEEKYEISYERKIKEAALAYQLEQIYSKEEILEMYLNTVYFGEGAYGVQAAAKVYFNKDVEYLNLSECAVLAGLLKSYLLSPYIDNKAALERRNLVLAKMLELGYIGQEEYDNTIGAPIITQRPREETEEIFAPYFVEYVKQKLIGEYGVERVFKGGFEIYTTLEPEMQIAAENAINEILPDPEDPAAALVAMDPRNGYIKAMVGGKDFTEMKLNLATQAKRQPGSTFKVFALLSALEQGVSPYMTFNPNGHVIFDIESSPPWEVGNYDNSIYDINEMSVLEATVKSVNVVYSQLIMRIGAYAMAQLANDMGIETPMEPYPAMGLGGLTTGVSALEVCTAFSTIANYGVKHEPIAILKVVDKDGNVIKEYDEENDEEIRQVLTPINAYRAIEIMQQVMLRGTGTRARLEDRPCAGKTGTTDETENAWFTGFTTNLAACVWMGFPETNIKMGTIHDMRVQGGAHPAMIWNLFMTEATKDLPIENFVRPQDDRINVQVVINPETGEMMIPNRFTPLDQIIVKEFRYGQEPTVQMPIPPEAIPIMPMVSLMPITEANQILIESGYTHIIYENQVFPEVPSGYTHRQDPLWGQPVETIRKITIWVNP